MHANPIRSYWWYLKNELTTPLNYLIAGLVGVVIQLGQGNMPWSSWVPYVTPLLVQSFSKAAVKHGNRYNALLLQLPAQRPDPTLVVARDGSIMACAGRTQELIDTMRFNRLDDFFGGALCDELRHILESDKEGATTCDAPPLNGRYLVQCVPVSDGTWWLVWMQRSNTQGNAAAG